MNKHDQAGYPMSKATMSRNRFSLLISKLPFNIPVGRHEKWMSIKGCNISMNRLLTSISPANWFLERNVTIVGIFQSKRIGIMKELKYPAGR